MTAGQGQIGQIDIKILLALRTIVRRVGHQEIHGTSGGQIAQVMQGALAGFVARGQMPTARAGTVIVVVIVSHQDGLGEVVDVDNTLGGVGYIFTGSEHGMVS